MADKTAPCQRCGWTRTVRKGRGDGLNVCKDCREADPHYVQAVLNRKRCA